MPPRPPRVGEPPTVSDAFSQNRWAQRMFDQRRTADQYRPPEPIEYNSMGIRADWDPSSSRNPDGDLLPEGAFGWTKYGTPSFGDPNDLSLMGDIKAGIDYWKWSFFKPVDLDKREVTAFSPEFWERVEKMVDDEPSGGGFRAEGMRGVPEFAKALFTETILGITEILDRAKNVDVGNDTANTALSYVGKSMTTALSVFGNAINIPAYQLKRGITARHLSNELLAERSTIPDMPVYEGWKGYLANNLYKYAYTYVQAIEAKKRWTQDEIDDIGQRAIDASRIGYSGVVIPGLANDYIKRMESGEDPRILAMELENIGIEAVGETLLDPLNAIGMMARLAKANKVRQASTGKWATIADPGLARLLVASPIDDAAQASEHMGDIVRQAGVMYDNTRAGLVTEAGARSAMSPTASSKAHLASREAQDYLGVVAAHHTGQPQRFLDTVEGLVKSASQDVATRTEGLDILAKRAGMTPETLFSEPANRTAIYLRDMLTDADGVFNPKATVLKDIAEAAGDVEAMIDIASRRLEKVYDARFPDIQTQVKQQKKFLELAATDPAEAARYLDLHPMADTTISRGMLAVANTHAGMQKYYFNPAYGVMGFVYMSLSPAYWMRNRLSNALHVAVTVGAPSGFKSFFWGEGDSLNQIKQMTGGSVPTGADFGFSPGGFDTPEAAAKRLFLGKAAKDEQASARIIVHKVLERELGRSLQEGAAIINPRDFGVSDDVATALVQHTKDSWGDADGAIKALIDTQGGNGRNLSFLSDAQQQTARQYRMYDQINDAIHSGNLDDALDMLDEIEDAWHRTADLTSRETAALDLSDATEAERRSTLNASEAIEQNVGEVEADLFQRQQHSGRAYRKKAREAINELETLAISEHQTRVTQRLLMAVDEFRAGNFDKAQEILSITVEGKAERLTINMGEFAELAKRGDPQEIAKVAGNISHSDVKFMSQPHMDAIDEMWEVFYKEHDAFTDETWNIHRRAAKRNITQDELKALWKEANFGVDPPEVLHRQHLRNKLWKRYRPTQEKRFFGVREKSNALHKLQAEFIGNLGEIPTDTQLMRNADVALETSRMFDDAVMAADGAAYVERVITFDTKRFSRALNKMSDRFNVKVIDGAIEGAAGEGLIRIDWNSPDARTGRIPFEISSDLLEKGADEIKDIVIRELGSVVLDELEGAEGLLDLFDGDVEKFSDALADYVKSGGIGPQEDIWKVVDYNEAIAKEQGLRAVYNAPLEGETGISGWGTDTYGEALTRAGGDESKIRVAYVTEDQYEAGRKAAIASDIERAGGADVVVEEAYQYTRFDEGDVDWQDVSRVGKPGPVDLEDATRVLIQDVEEGIADYGLFEPAAGDQVARGGEVTDTSLMRRGYTSNRPWVLEARRKGYSNAEITYVLEKIQSGDEIPSVVSVTGKGVAKEIVGEGAKIEGATNRSKALRKLLEREFEAFGGGSLADEVESIAREGRPALRNAAGQIVAEEVPALHVPSLEAAETISPEARAIGNALNDPANARAKNLLDDVGSITPTKKQIPLIAPADDAMPTVTRMHHESRAGVSRFVDEVRQSFRDNWSSMADPPQIDAATRRQMREWATATKPRVTEARLVATDVANVNRDFALHDYGNRLGIDLPAGMIYPYQFWYSRTYAKWVQRVATHPDLIAAYFRYRRYMEKKHAGLPDWYKYQLNTNELLGLDMENPLYFNLESSLNPLQGLTGVDFDDPRKRVDWVSRTLDDLGKFGPTVWTPYTIALAVGYQMQGQDEAASRWAGRVTTGTRMIRDVTALLGADEGRGVEVDPLIHMFSGGIGPYERRRIGRQLGEMEVENPELAEDLINAGYNQEGPLWDEAHSRMVQERAFGNTFGWIFGTGFKPRSQTDIQIDRMYNDIYGLIKQRDNYTTEEYRQLWDQTRATYPFMDTVLLSRKGGVERDEALAWNVLRRIPPGMTDDLMKAAGLPYETVDNFYENKGDLTLLSDSERMRFMASVIDLSLILEIPSDATSFEWSAARSSYTKMMDFAKKVWGDDIWDRVDNYYGARDDDNRDKADAILKADPHIENALDWKGMQVVFDPNLAPYYGGLDKVESYYKGLMYAEIEDELGEEIWDTWSEYWRRKDTAQDASDFYKDHPELERYGEIVEKWEPLIAKHLVEFGSNLPEPIGAKAREDFQPFDPLHEQLSRAVATMGGSRVPQQFVWTREQWAQELGEPLLNLVDDYIIGDELTTAAEVALERAAERLMIPGGGQTVLALVIAALAESVVAPRTGQASPPTASPDFQRQLPAPASTPSPTSSMLPPHTNVGADVGGGGGGGVIDMDNPAIQDMRNIGLSDATIREAMGHVVAGQTIPNNVLGKIVDELIAAGQAEDSGMDLFNALVASYKEAAPIGIRDIYKDVSA